MVTDMGFADDIVLVSEEIDQAQELLSRVENAALEVRLHMNAKKTKITTYNIDTDITIKTKDDTTLEKLDDFKYLRSWKASTEKHMN